MPTDGPIGFGVDLRFEDAQLTHNNLGGYGPDSGVEEVRFTGVGNSYGRDLDLVVTVDADYEPSNTEQNRVNGNFGGLLLL